jgi:hypothetical protein
LIDVAGALALLEEGFLDGLEALDQLFVLIIVADLILVVLPCCLFGFGGLFGLRSCFILFGFFRAFRLLFGGFGGLLGGLLRLDGLFSLFFARWFLLFFSITLVLWINSLGVLFLGRALNLSACRFE